jgi:hypothetical protein
MGHQLNSPHVSSRALCPGPIGPQTLGLIGADGVSTYFTYIVASKPRGTLYIGVTNNLIRRVEEHQQGVASAFTRKHKVRSLVRIKCSPRSKKPFSARKR